MLHFAVVLFIFACGEEVTYEVEPCLSAEEEAQCMSAEDAFEDLQEQNEDCSIEDVVYEGFLDGLCCYDMVAYDCG